MKMQFHTDSPSDSNRIRPFLSRLCRHIKNPRLLRARQSLISRCHSNYDIPVADLGGVGGVQMNPPLKLIIMSDFAVKVF